MKWFINLIVSVLKGMKSSIQALFRNMIAFMKVIGGIFRMMFQNILKFLRRATTFVIEMYHAIIDMLVQFIKALWELMIALSILVLFYVPGIAGIVIDKFVWHHPALWWGAWGYIALMTAIGIFYRPEGATLFAQSDSDLTKFFASNVLADNHYFQFIKELVQRWKELHDSISTEESQSVIDHLKSVQLHYEQVLTACNDYCKQGRKIRHYLERKNSEKLVEEWHKRQLEASATKDEKTRQNYLTTVAKLEDELRQIEFYRKKLERLDSYFIKVSATINNVHSKVLQMGVSDDLQNLEGNLFQDLEIETQAIDEVLQSTDTTLFEDKEINNASIGSESSQVGNGSPILLDMTALAEEFPELNLGENEQSHTHMQRNEVTPSKKGSDNSTETPIPKTEDHSESS